MNLIDMLNEKGFDYEGSIIRFGDNKEMYFRFLLKFKNDLNYKMFIDAMKDDKYDDAYFAIHTLKGTSANLGIVKLSSTASEIQICLKENKYTEAKKLIEVLKKYYDEAIEMIDILEKQ